MEVDKLVKYIDWRSKRYGLIKTTQCISSNYYHIGDTVVRISDHIKYGLSSVNRFDYCFIIQDNDQYIFTASPKHNSTKTTQLYLKVVSFEEAKEFVKSLHDYEIQMQKMGEIFHPQGWNNITGEETHCMTWTEFYKEYLETASRQQKQQLLDTICYMLDQEVPKGNVDTKLSHVAKRYKELSEDELISFLSEFDEKCPDA